MANHKSAQKRIIQNRRRQMRNKFFRTTMRTRIKQLRDAVAAGSKDEASTTFLAAVKSIDKCKSKGVIHKNQASRRVSRLARLVNTL